jgi:shikimate kinase
MIRLVGPGGAGKTTAGAILAGRLSVDFVDLDDRFTATFGDISEYLRAHGYKAYAERNVQTYLDVTGPEDDQAVLALSSGFMTYREDIHPAYASHRQHIASSRWTFVLLPSVDVETCVAETVCRQLGRRFSRSAEREEQVVRTRLALYRDLPLRKIETMRPVADVVEDLVAAIAAQQALEPTPRGDGILTPRGAAPALTLGGTPVA